MSLTLKRISNWSLYKIWYYNYATLLKQCIWSLVTLYCTPIYRLTERKNPFPCTKLSMQNGRCEIKLCAQAPLARQGNNQIWKEIISHWLSSMKNIKYCENKHTWMGSSTRKLLSVTIQGNITAMRYRWRHLVGSFFSLARDYVSCHAARTTLVMLVANNVQKFGWPAKSLD